MSNTIRTRKAPALIEDTGITWSVQCQRLAKTAAVAVVFSALAACGVQNDAETLSNLAATKEMSIPVYQSKEDCDKAASIAGKSLNGDNAELNFSCDSVDTTKLANIEDAPANAGEPTSTALTSNAAPATTTPHSSSGGGGNPLMWYMLGNMMGNRSGVTSSAFAPSAGAPAPSAFINSSGNGKMSMSATQQFATPTPGQYAGLKNNGGVLKTGTIGSNLARAATYKSSTSSIGSKSSVSSSVGHSSGGRGGGSSGGGGG